LLVFYMSHVALSHGALRREVERRNATILRSAAAANAEVASAAKKVQTAQEQVKDATQGRVQAEQVLLNE